jgi:hypothetical protein
LWTDESILGEGVSTSNTVPTVESQIFLDPDLGDIELTEFWDKYLAEECRFIRGTGIIMCYLPHFIRSGQEGWRVCAYEPGVGCHPADDGSESAAPPFPEEERRWRLQKTRMPLAAWRYCYERNIPVQLHMTPPGFALQEVVWPRKNSEEGTAVKVEHVNAHGLVIRQDMRLYPYDWECVGMVKPGAQPQHAVRVDDMDPAELECCKRKWVRVFDVVTKK